LTILARPERLFAAFGRESLAALGTVAAARRRPSRRRTAPLVELPTPWFVGRLKIFRYPVNQWLAALASYSSSLIQSQSRHTQFELVTLPTRSVRSLWPGAELNHQHADIW